MEFISNFTLYKGLKPLAETFVNNPKSFQQGGFSPLPTVQ
jgi:hypothetical protein